MLQNMLQKYLPIHMAAPCAARLADAGVVVAARADGQRAQAGQIGQEVPAAPARRRRGVLLRLRQRLRWSSQHFI